MYLFLLNFDKSSKDFNKDYAFDIDEQKCDVVLTFKNVQNINEIHFHILFDVINKKNRFVWKILQSTKRRWIIMIREKKKNKHYFIWILNLKKLDKMKKKTKNWKINIHVWEFSFKIKFVNHQICVIEYEKKMIEFLNHSRNQIVDSFLDDLSIISCTIEMTFNSFHIFE
jgi:hypothetical protein